MVKHIFVALFILIPLVAAAVVVYRSKSTHYECPQCGHTFKVPLLRFLLATHIGAKSYVTCPRCHHTDLMVAICDDKPPGT
jgi:DNA-directed RNA polymerase subunit RPC12/RpoP